MALPIIGLARLAASATGGVQMGAEVTGEKAVAERIERLAGRLKDLRTPNRAVAVQLYQWTIRNFDQEGGLLGGWIPLRPATVRQKARIGKEKMLVRTGQLRNSLISFSSNDNAGIGSALSYAKFHQFGAKNLPQREMLPRRETVNDIGLRVYDFYISQQVRQAGGA